MAQRLWVIGLTALVLLWLPPSRAWAEDKSLSGLTEDELKKSFDQLSPKWYPTAIKGYAKGNESRYDVTWKKGDPGWFLYWNQSAAEFAKVKAQHAKKGFKVAVESTWNVNGEDRFASIFRKK